MKPRTKLEKEVTWLSSHLLPPSMEQIDDAEQHLFTPKAFYTKKHGYVCMECGHRFRIPGHEDLTGFVTCPHCGKFLRPEKTTKRKDEEYKTYMLMQTVHHEGKEFIVQRLFSVSKFVRVGEPKKVEFSSVAEFFTTEGHQVCLGIPITQNGSWSFTQPLTIKKESKSYYGYYGTSYDSYQHKPSYMFTESIATILTRNGFKGHYERYIPQEFVRLLMCSPDFEQLYKLGNHKYIAYAEHKILNQLKIANRHHYDIRDVNLWVDVISLLRKLKMDDRNPKHICPANIREWHQELYAKWQRVLDKEAAERRRLDEIRRREDELKRLEREKDICEEYVKRISRFLQLHIQDELISIAPIPTVEAVHEEGNAMHHCVFQCGYYKRPEVLLLSARDHFGNRVETIEVNLKTYQVAQSRGVCNKNTEHHDRILSLMERGMEQIREMNTRKITIKAA